MPPGRRDRDGYAHRLGLAPRLRRRCLGVGVRPLLRVWDTRAPVAQGQQEAAAEEIKRARPNISASTSSEAVDVPFDRAGRPRQGDAGFDRLIVVAEPGRKRCIASGHWWLHPREPRIELVRLPLSVPEWQSPARGRSPQRPRPAGPATGSVAAPQPQCVTPHGGGQATSPAGRRGWETGSATTGGSGKPLAAGWDALGLADAANIRGDTAIAPGVAPQLELPKRLDGGVAAGVPALQDIGLIRVEDAESIVAAMLPHQGHVGRCRCRSMVRQLQPTWAAMATLGQPWRLEGPDLLVAPVAAPARWAACCSARAGMGGGGTGTAGVPSASRTGCWCLAALTAVRAS